MIHVESKLSSLPVVESLIRTTAQVVLDHEAAGGDLTIALGDDAQTRRLNRDYMGLDAPTDVLSFPADELDPDTARSYLGDVVISVERAAAQAASAGHPLEAEVQLLIVHGVLHLLGYDHAEPEARRRMWAVQAAVLERLGLGGIKIQE